MPSGVLVVILIIGFLAVGGAVGYLVVTSPMRREKRRRRRIKSESFKLERPEDMFDLGVRESISELNHEDHEAVWGSSSFGSMEMNETNNPAVVHVNVDPHKDVKAVLVAVSLNALPSIIDDYGDRLGEVVLGEAKGFYYEDDGWFTAVVRDGYQGWRVTVRHMPSNDAPTRDKEPGEAETLCHLMSQNIHLITGTATITEVAERRNK